MTVNQGVRGRLLSLPYMWTWERLFCVSNLLYINYVKKKSKSSKPPGGRPVSPRPSCGTVMIRAGTPSSRPVHEAQGSLCFLMPPAVNGPQGDYPAKKG